MVIVSCQWKPARNPPFSAFVQDHSPATRAGRNPAVNVEKPGFLSLLTRRQWIGHPRATRKKCGGAMHGRRHLLGVSKPAYSSRRKASTSKGTATTPFISTRPRTGGQPCAATRPRRPRPAASRSAGARRSGRGPCSPPGCPTGCRWRPSGTTCVASPPPFPRGAPCRSPR